jgi:hypothetical protein
MSEAMQAQFSAPGSWPSKTSPLPGAFVTLAHDGRQASAES